MIELTALFAVFAIRPQLMTDENLELLSIIATTLACKISEDSPNINRFTTIRLLHRVGANLDEAKDDSE